MYEARHSRQGYDPGGSFLCNVVRHGHVRVEIYVEECVLRTSKTAPVRRRFFAMVEWGTSVAELNEKHTLSVTALGI